MFVFTLVTPVILAGMLINRVHNETIVLFGINSYLFVSQNQYIGNYIRLITLLEMHSKIR